MAFKKATKQQAKLRLALEGPAGSGKTYTGLVIASKLGARVAVIDSEHGSAAKYADRFAFDVDELAEHSIQTYLARIREAGEAGYDVLMVDSLSHAWVGKGGALEMVDRLGAKNKFTNGWGQVTPLQNQLIDALLAYPGHVIVTMRTKTEYVLEDRGGKQVPRKVGLAPVQRDGVEYEFDVIVELTIDGDVTVTKTRCPALAGPAALMKYAEVPDMAAKLKAWLSDGAAPAPKPAPVRAAPTPADDALEPPPHTDSDAPDDFEQITIALGECQSLADLQRLVPRIQRLDAALKDQIRTAYGARVAELSRAAS